MFFFRERAVKLPAWLIVLIMSWRAFTTNIVFLIGYWSTELVLAREHAVRYAQPWLVDAPCHSVTFFDLPQEAWQGSVDH